MKHSLVAPDDSEVEARSVPVTEKDALVDLSLDASKDFVAEDCVLSEPVVEVDSLVSSPGSDVPPRGQASSDSLTEVGVASASPGFLGSLFSEAWVVEAAKIEDSWLQLSGRRSLFLLPPL